MRNGLGGMQSALVLGGGSEIAAATVDRLIANRCRTVVLAARRPDELSELVDRFRGAGAETVDTITFDARDSASHEKVLGDVFDTYGQIDLVLSAFGVLGDQEHFDDHPAEAAEAVAVNFGGQVSALLVVADRMKRQGQGTIAVLSSVAAERVRASNVTYGATKAGLDAFCQGLSDRLVGTGVRVMVIRPGFVTTKMTEGMDKAPFSTTPEAVADDIMAGLTKGSETVWSPAVLRYVFSVMRHLPRPIWRKVAARG